MIDVQALAEAQDHARRTVTKLALPAGYGETGIEGGYAVQQASIGLNTRRGNPLQGWKVAMSSPAAMERFALEKPIYAPLFADMLLREPLLDVKQVHAPKIEVEVAFILGRDLVDSGCSVDEILAAIEFVAPAFEVADSRTGWQFDGPTFVADGAVASHYRLGTPARFDPCFDFAGLGCEMRAGDEVLTGSGGNLIGGPLNSVVSMIRDLIGRFGRVAAGQHLLSGSLTRPLDMVAGTRYRLELLGQELELDYR